MCNIHIDVQCVYKSKYVMYIMYVCEIPHIWALRTNTNLNQDHVKKRNSTHMFHKNHQANAT